MSLPCEGRWLRRSRSRRGAGSKGMLSYRYDMITARIAPLSQPCGCQLPSKGEPVLWSSAFLGQEEDDILQVGVLGDEPGGDETPADQSLGPVGGDLFPGHSVRVQLLQLLGGAL